MLANVLTCVGTGTLGVGVGLVINTIRARTKRNKRKRLESTKLTQIPETKNPTKRNKNNQDEADVLEENGLRTHLRTLDSFLETPAQIKALSALETHLRRILTLVAQKDVKEQESKYWNCAGAIATNVSKVKLWCRTLNSMIDEHLDTVPEQWTEALQFVVDFVAAEQYNQIKDLGT